MPLPFNTAPEQLCILRLSAVGDICHILPVVRTLQKQWPATRLTWIIGKTEYSLIHDIPDIDFIVFDKSKGLRGHLDIRRQLRHRQFDALLHMQMSLRASLISLFVNTPIKLGFDRNRAKDMQGLFCNNNIPHLPRQHVMDSLFGFSETLGIASHHLDWNIPLGPSEYDFIKTWLPDNNPYIVISPCSSKSYRNWNIEGYAAIANYAINNYGLHVCVTGGPSDIEKDYAKQIAVRVKAGGTSSAKLINLVAKTSLKQLLAILDKAVCVVAPDSGPVHMATAVHTPVLGLYATTNPDRARAYFSQDWLVNRYPDAVRDKYGKQVDDVTWGTRVRDAGTMDRISTDEVKLVLDKLMAEFNNNATA